MSSAKMLLKRIFSRLPPQVQIYMRAVMRKRRDAQVASRKKRTQVSANEIVNKLSRLDLSGDIIIHGSISSIGKLDCSVPELLQRWLATIDLTAQTVICPALPYKSTMAEYLNSGIEFDVRSAPNSMGAISNIVMGMSAAKRSLHPTHSCVAIGKNAEYYCSDHEKDTTPFGRNSPFRKLTDRRGKILMFGVGLNSVTNFHVYEDMLGKDLPFEVYLPKSYDVKCIDVNGDSLVVSTRCHDPSMSAARECERARPFLQRAGVITTHRIGDAELSAIDARAFSVVLLQMLLGGQSIYGKVALTASQKVAVERCMNELL